MTVSSHWHIALDFLTTAGWILLIEQVSHINGMGNLELVSTRQACPVDGLCAFIHMEGKGNALGLDKVIKAGQFCVRVPVDCAQWHLGCLGQGMPLDQLINEAI